MKGRPKLAVRVYVLSKLRDGADPKAYERWVREVDYPLARRLGPIKSYDVTRLKGSPLEGFLGAPYDYLEVIEVSDLDDYRAALDPNGDPDVARLFEDWNRFIGSAVAAYGEVIE